MDEMNVIIKRSIWFLLLAIFFFPSATEARCDCRKVETVVIETALKRVPFKVEIARTPQALKKGLMFRHSIEEDEGMLFVFPSPRRAQFWMQNTYVSLDLIFIDEYGIVVEIMQRATPLSEKKLVSAINTVKAVLEVPAGTAKNIHLDVGDRVRHPIFKVSKTSMKNDCQKRMKS